MADDNFNVEVDVDEIKRLAENDFPNIIDKAVRLTAEEVWGNISREAPTDHGRLAGSWNLKQIGLGRYGIWSNVEYRWWVHEGTGVHGPHGHPIVPVGAPFLQFEIDGQIIRKKEVQGQEPNRYIDRAINQAEKRTDDFIQQAVRGS